MKNEKEDALQLEITANHLNTLMNAVEQVRTGKLPQEKLREIVEQMKNRIESTMEKLPEITEDLKKMKTSGGIDPVVLIKDGLNVYQKAFNVLNLFLVDANEKHLEEGLKIAKEAQDKFSDLYKFVSRVTGI